MALFHYRCPRCNEISFIDPEGYCHNILRDHSICGYRMPLRYDLANNKLRTKIDKHTSPPPPINVGTWSWVENKDDYSLFHKFNLIYGTVNLNKQDNYLFLWQDLSGESPKAHVMYGDAGTVATASGVISPLNSSIQNIHSFFGNREDNWEEIAPGHNLVIE